MAHVAPQEESEMQIDLNKLSALAEILGGAASPAPTSHPADQLMGQFVIVRSRDSGVHAGTLVSVQDRTIRLTGSRRLWYWKAAKGHTLSGVALHGLDPAVSKIAGEVGEIVILDVCEIIPTTPAAGQSILGVSEYVPS